MAGETLGERMKAAADAKGLGPYKIAKKLDVYAPAVYKWWKNKDRPTAQNLELYARVVGVPVEQLDPDPLALAREAAYQEAVDDVLAVFGAVAAGEPIPAVAGHRSPQVAQFLAERGGEIQTVLNELAGGEWQELSPARQRAALEQMARRLLEGAGHAPERSD